MKRVLEQDQLVDVRYGVHRYDGREGQPELERIEKMRFTTPGEKRHTLRLRVDVRGKERSPGEYEMEYVPGEYVVGWAKRGPSGLIGVNKMDSIETVKMLFEDFTGSDGPPRTAVKPERDAIERLLTERGIKCVNFSGWKRIDQLEVASGKEKSKIREKLCEIPDLLSAAEDGDGKAE